MSNRTQPATSPHWWGEYTLAEGEAAFWSIGPTDVWVRHRMGEWVVGTHTRKEPGDETVRIESPTERDVPEGAELCRYAFRDTGATITLSPLPADRPVIGKPETPLVIPPGEESRLRVRSPLWVRISAGGTNLKELPLFRPSDTWFGTSTRPGGLAYAASTRALLATELPQASPIRAVTPVLVRNRSATPLTIERLALPLPYLSLFIGSDGVFWTESVTLNREREDEEAAMLQVGGGAPREAEGGQLIAAARQPAGKNFVFQAFSTLFS